MDNTNQKGEIQIRRFDSHTQNYSILDEENNLLSPFIFSEISYETNSHGREELKIASAKVVKDKNGKVEVWYPHNCQNNPRYLKKKIKEFEKEQPRAYKIFLGSISLEARSLLEEGLKLD